MDTDAMNSQEQMPNVANSNAQGSKCMMEVKQADVSASGENVKHCTGNMNNGVIGTTTISELNEDQDKFGADEITILSFEEPKFYNEDEFDEKKVPRQLEGTSFAIKKRLAFLRDDEKNYRRAVGQLKESVANYNAKLLEVEGLIEVESENLQEAISTERFTHVIKNVISPGMNGIRQINKLTALFHEIYENPVCVEQALQQITELLREIPGKGRKESMPDDSPTSGEGENRNKTTGWENQVENASVKRPQDELDLPLHTPKRIKNGDQMKSSENGGSCARRKCNLRK
ncbi:unnamed protein product [Orchesella dallaii]|uniref:Uncharacterized protein n=1 Tax=Orchesella dallaii TaxID=48710 RepID=A0ABP1S160_9HEXA